MAKWVFEPGHTAAEFCARHMMVTWVRGSFKNIEGTIEFDPENPINSSVDVSIDAASLWSGDEARDGHLRGSEFLDVENHPKITFKGNEIQLMSEHEFKVIGDLALRGTTRKAILDVRYLGHYSFSPRLHPPPIEILPLDKCLSHRHLVPTLCVPSEDRILPV